MLLDLNVGIICRDSVCDETRSEMEAEEEPPTSSSSVVSADDGRNNAAEGKISSTDTSPLIFDVFKRESETHAVNGKSPAPEFVTRQLFPFTGDGESGSSASAKTQWLNLSFVDKSGQAELRIVQQKQQQVRKSRRGPRSRSSQYRGVTFYRRTGRWESHIWDCGKQVYLGGFDTAHSAARAYDQAAIKFRGVDADINFSLGDYEGDMKQTQNLSKEEFVLTLRRQSTGFARGGSKYRGATLTNCGALVARNGQFLGKMAYDNGGIQYVKKEAGANFVTNPYEGDRVVPTNSGNGHNLDLSLGMSPTSDCRKGVGNVKDFRFQYVAGKMLTGEGKMVTLGNDSLAGESLDGLPVPSRPAWSNIYPGFFPTYEGRSAEKKVEAATSRRLPNWAWQSNAGTTSTVPVYTSAASSGFDSSTTFSNLLSAVPLHQQNYYSDAKRPS